MLSHVGVKCFSSLVSAESKFSVKSIFLSISLRFCGVVVRGEKREKENMLDIQIWLLFDFLTKNYM
jgi:hypothetical protein